MGPVAQQGSERMAAVKISGGKGEEDGGGSTGYEGTKAYVCQRCG